MRDYFAGLMLGEFRQFFADDVTWTTVETGAVVRGPGDVERALLGLHGNMSDMETRRVTLGAGSAYLEGDCRRPAGADRIAYCVAYDLSEGRITAMRAYGPLSAMMPSTR